MAVVLGTQSFWPDLAWFLSLGGAPQSGDTLIPLLNPAPQNPAANPDLCFVPSPTPRVAAQISGWPDLCYPEKCQTFVLAGAL